jgi:hypothetical protein
MIVKIMLNGKYLIKRDTSTIVELYFNKFFDPMFLLGYEFKRKVILLFSKFNHGKTKNM